MIKFEKPTTAMVQYIADHMRNEDVAEVWAYNRSTPIDALFNSWKISDYTVIVTVNNVPCVMIGLVITDILTGYGIPWMLGTDGALKHRREFLKLSPPVIKDMLKICPMLYNYVHVDNTHSVAWLKWLGFTLCDPIPFGAGGEMFSKFYIEASDNV